MMIEAMAMGIPGVAFDIPGVNRLIENEQNGLLAEFGNKDQLIGCWRQLLFDDKFQNKIAQIGIKRSSFSDAVNHRGLEQLLYIFEKLQADAAHTLPKEYAHLGDLVSIDDSLIDAVLSLCIG